MTFLSRTIIAGLVLLGLTSCGGGGDGEGTTRDPVPTTSIDSDATFAPYEVIQLNISNYSLAEETYQATIDGEIVVSLAKISASSGAMLVPPLPDGNHEVSIDLGGYVVAFSFVSKQVAVPYTAEEILDSTMPGLLFTLDEEIASANQTSGMEEHRAWLEQLKQSVNDIPAQVAALSPAQQLEIAAILYHNFIAGRELDGQALMQASFTQVCTDRLRKVRLTGLLVATDIATIGVGLLFPPPFNLVVGSIGAVTLLSNVKLLKEATTSLFDVCWSEIEDELTSGLSSAVKSQGAAGGNLDFFHETPEVFNIETKYSLENSIFEELKVILNKISNLPRALFPLSISSWLANIEPFKVSDSPASTYSVLSTSDPNIIGAATEFDGKLKLTFSFIELPDRQVPKEFTFTLIDSRDGHTSEFSAALSFTIEGTWYLNHHSCTDPDHWINDFNNGITYLHNGYSAVTYSFDGLNFYMNHSWDKVTNIYTGIFLPETRTIQGDVAHKYVCAGDGCPNGYYTNSVDCAFTMTKSGPWGK